MISQPKVRWGLFKLLHFYGFHLLRVPQLAPVVVKLYRQLPGIFPGRLPFSVRIAGIHLSHGMFELCRHTAGFCFQNGQFFQIFVALREIDPAEVFNLLDFLLQSFVPQNRVTIPLLLGPGQQFMAGFVPFHFQAFNNTGDAGDSRYGQLVVCLISY